jgi:hypothetical protein
MSPEGRAGKAVLAAWGTAILYALEQARAGADTTDLEASAKHAIAVAVEPEKEACLQAR